MSDLVAVSLSNSILQSSPPVNGQHLPPATDGSKECAYELAKDFADETSQPRKDADPVYTVPTSNRLIHYIQNQRILYRVSPWIILFGFLSLDTHFFGF